jgi:hypothetical protein
MHGPYLPENGDIMDVLFTFGVGWLAIVYGSVFVQTKSYGALMVSLGAVATVLVSSLPSMPEIANLTLVVGKLSFWGGLAILATFDRKTEAERIRTSSWGEIITGNVPAHLQKTQMSQRARFVAVLLFSGLFAGVFFVMGNTQMAAVFLIIGLVFASYYFTAK